MRKRHLISAFVATGVVASLGIVITASAQADSEHNATEPEIRHSTNTASTREMDDYWTPERIAAAEPVAAPDRQTTSQPLGEVGDPVTIEGSDAAGMTETIGRLFFSTDEGDYVCSANVVASDNKSVIATARHCGFEDGGTNYRFAPNFEQGEAPHGWWDWSSAGWVTGGDGITNDFAFIVLGTQDGRPVADAVGSSGIGFNQPIDNDAHIVGIPAETDSVTHCEGRAYAGPENQQLMDDCDGMSGGASGGAWTIDYQEDGSATQVGTFFGSRGEAAAGSYLSDSAHEVWEDAQAA